ncbi:MAG: ABC transporter substrate-binding protein, partial [Desulfuromonas sp.]
MSNKSFKVKLMAALLAAGLLFAAGSALAADAAEKKVITWRLAMTWPSNFPILGEAVEKMAA